MFQAQYLFKDNAVYSPWMSRGGDDLRASFELVQRSAAAANLLVTMVEKNEEDTGNGTPREAAGEQLTLSGTAPDRAVKEWNAVKEMVRFRFEVDGTGLNVYDNVLFRTLSPVWFDAVDAPATP